MNKLLTSILIFFSTFVYAAPTLMADPYPVTGIQPASATFTIDGGTPKSCNLVPITGGLQPQCDLASITAPGSYVLVLTVSTIAGCTTIPDISGTCATAGVASSTPFQYSLQGPAAKAKGLKLSQ